MDEENKEQNTENTKNEQSVNEINNSENINNEQTKAENNVGEETKAEPLLDTKTLKICTVVFLAALIGSFSAMYFAADKYFSYKFRPTPPHHKPVIEAKFRPERIPDFDVFDDFERRIEQEQNEFFNKHSMRPGIRKNMKHYKADIIPFSISPVKVKTEKDGDRYNIIVSLKPFQNNPDKVSYIFSGNKITVFGKNETFKENTETSVSFSQDFILPPDADVDKTEKIRDGNKLIISIPVKD